MFNVSAVAPQWTYECNKLALPVNVNGQIDGNEWDDAVELIVNNDSPIFQQYGFWQNGGADPIPSSVLSVTYKVKWDETYLYILEVRNDKFFKVFPEDESGPWPWEHSGTLFFLYYDKDGEAMAEDTASWDYCYEPFWITYGWGDKPILSGRASGKSQFEVGDPEMEGWITAGSKNGDVYTFEAAIPWATMQKASEFPAPTEGLKLRFTPIISAFHTLDTEKFSDQWNQLDFYVDTGAPDNPAGYGGMELVGVRYTPPAPDPEPDPEPDAPAAVVDTPPPARPSPATGDSALIMLALAALAAAALVTFRKVRVR